MWTRPTLRATLLFTLLAKQVQLGSIGLNKNCAISDMKKVNIERNNFVHVIYNVEVAKG